MPIYVSIENSPRHVHREYVGAITLQDLVNAFYTTAELKGYDATLPQMNDLRRATLDTSAEQLEQFFRSIANKPEYHQGKAAIVVNTQVAKVLEESFKLLTQLTLGYKMFSDIESARAFLFDTQRL